MNKAKKLCLCILLGMIAAGCAQARSETPNAPAASADTKIQNTNNLNNYMVAVAWKQNAAEYNALYYHGFNIAKMHVEEALKNHKDTDKPLAIVTDFDDTLATPLEYWGYLIEQGNEAFDDEIWDAWIPENKMTPTAGAKEFLDFCQDNHVEVFYVTSRDQGEKTYEYALNNIKALSFPYADKEHLFVLMDTSNKEEIQNKIAETHDIIVKLGDNLNDFSRRYYVSDVDERNRLMAQDKDLYGVTYVLFPNPTDGHWIKSIFGESEPADTEENREIWKQAAMKHKWKK